MQHCQFFHKSKIKKGKFTHLGGSSVNGKIQVHRVSRNHDSDGIGLQVDADVCLYSRQQQR